MRQIANLKPLLYLFLIITNFSCGQQKNNEKLNFKNTIELSIGSVSSKVNPLIKEIGILLKENNSDDKLIERYNICKSTITLNKKLISELDEVDIDINLKSGTIEYLENCEKILESFILPVIKYVNEFENIDRNKLIESFSLIQITIQQTSDLSESLEIFCHKHKLPREMKDFDKNDYNAKISELKTKLGKLKN